eukprot:3651170-Lingulodinium_polyedra.AAC.1
MCRAERGRGSPKRGAPCAHATQDQAMPLRATPCNAPPQCPAMPRDATRRHATSHHAMHCMHNRQSCAK